MSVSVIYSTEAFLRKNKDQVGKQSGPVRFASLEGAKAATIPEGYTFGVIQDESGTARYSYSEKSGWRPCDEP
jgi:hypothetical protein